MCKTTIQTRAALILLAQIYCMKLAPDAWCYLQFKMTARYAYLVRHVRPRHPLSQLHLKLPLPASEHVPRPLQRLFGHTTIREKFIQVKTVLISPNSVD